MESEYYDPVFEDSYGFDWLSGSGNKAEKQRKELERLEAHLEELYNKWGEQGE